MAFAAPALPFIAAGASIAGTALAAKGAADAGAAQQSAYNANAAAQRVKAQTDQDAAEAEARLTETANERRYGGIRSDYAAAGVDVNTGSPLEVMADQHAQGALQASLQRYQGKVQALQDVQSADINVQQGRAAKSAGNITAGATLLTGLGKAVSPFVPVPTGGR
jgi:hypothetical protein